jgi:hypothetical protein
VLPTNNSYYSSTSNHHRWSHRCLRVRDNRQGARGETPLSETRRGGIRHAVVQSPAELAPRPRDPLPGSAATAATLLFLPPALSLVHHPVVYLPASIPILVLLTPARNSASLPAHPSCLPPTATTTPTTSPASTPRWTHRRRTTGRGPPSPRRHRPHRPQRGGEGCRTQCPVAPRITQPLCQVSGTSARSSLIVVIVGGGLVGLKRRWWRLPGAEAAAEKAAAGVIIG